MLWQRLTAARRVYVNVGSLSAGRMSAVGSGGGAGERGAAPRGEEVGEEMGELEEEKRRGGRGC